MPEKFSPGTNSRMAPGQTGILCASIRVRLWRSAAGLIDWALIIQ
jgi:hypothetical protein